MKIVNTNHRIVAALLEEIKKEDTFLLNGPCGTQIVVMSREAFLQANYLDAGTSTSRTASKGVSGEACERLKGHCRLIET